MAATTTPTTMEVRTTTRVVDTPTTPARVARATLREAASNGQTRFFKKEDPTQFDVNGGHFAQVQPNKRTSSQHWMMRMGSRSCTFEAEPVRISIRKPNRCNNCNSELKHTTRKAYVCSTFPLFTTGSLLVASLVWTEKGGH